jgi:hypothetical protein
MKDKKEMKRAQLNRNKMKGQAGELEARVMANLSGFEVEKRPNNPGGPDFNLTRRNILSRKVIDKKTLEAKTGNSPIRKSQKNADIVYRTSAFPLNLFDK